MLGPDVIKAVRKVSAVPADIHLMVKNPERHLHLFDLREGDIVAVHQESTIHLQRTLAAIRQAGAKAAVAINPATPLCVLEDVLPDIDMVVVMTVNPGFAGQKLVPQTLNKITRLRKMLDENGYEHVRIEVDGNCSFENGAKMRAAGADIFVCGTSSIFRKEGTITENVARLRACVADK